VKPIEVRKQIESGETAPLYLLEGDDLQSRHDLALEFAGLVDEGLHAFNVQSFHANEATTASARDQLMGDIIAAARTLPMMAPRRVLLVHEAEKLLSPRKGKDDEEAVAVAPASGGRKKQRVLTPSEEFEAYLESPEPMTTLVFAAGALDGNRRLVKLLRKRAVAVDCGSLHDDPAEAARWVKAYFQKEGFEIEPKAVTTLLRATGLTLGRIRAECEKLVLYVGGEKTITLQHVKDATTPSDDPTDGPAVGFAIRDGDVKKALREVTALLDSGAPHLPLLGQIRWGAGLLRPDARAKRGLDLVLETDLALKSSGGEARYLIEKLVIELCER
jgi:DNA polymerase III subunit delta